MEWEFVPYERLDARGALLVAALPAGGLVGAVAAGFLVRQLGLRMVGGFQSLEMAPVGVVRGGVVSGPIQVWAAELACGPDGQCDKLLVLKADVAPPLEHLIPLADAVVRWAAKSGIKLIVGLEAFPDEKGESPGVHLAMSRAGAEFAKNVKADPIAESVLMGFTAALLLRANREEFPAVALFAPVAPKANEAAIAASLVDIVDPLLPHVPLQADELLRASEQVAVELAREREAQEKAARKLTDGVDRGYV